MIMAEFNNWILEVIAPSRDEPVRAWISNPLRKVIGYAVASTVADAVRAAFLKAESHYEKDPYALAGLVRAYYGPNCNELLDYPHVREEYAISDQTVATERELEGAKDRFIVTTDYDAGYIIYNVVDTRAPKNEQPWVVSVFSTKNQNDRARSGAEYDCKLRNERGYKPNQPTAPE
jgi:hypothetical protein